MQTRWLILEGAGQFLNILTIFINMHSAAKNSRLIILLERII